MHYFIIILLTCAHSLINCAAKAPNHLSQLAAPDEHTQLLAAQNAFLRKQVAQTVLALATTKAADTQQDTEDKELAAMTIAGASAGAEAQAASNSQSTAVPTCLPKTEERPFSLLNRKNCLWLTVPTCDCLESLPVKQCTDKYHCYFSLQPSGDWCSPVLAGCRGSCIAYAIMKKNNNPCCSTQTERIQIINDALKRAYANYPDCGHLKDFTLSWPNPSDHFGKFSKQFLLLKASDGVDMISDDPYVFKKASDYIEYNDYIGNNPNVCAKLDAEHGDLPWSYRPFVVIKENK